MMISPEMYVESEIRGKAKEDMLRKIRGLKQEIGRLRNKVDIPQFEDIIIEPSPDTRLKVYKDYLRCAIKEYEASGGEYRMSNKEKKAAAFDADIENIISVELEYGGFFCGTERRKVYFDGDKIKTERSFYNGAIPFEELLFLDMNKQSFLSELRDIHIGEWKHGYDNPNVLDGIQWELVIGYTDKRSRKYWGSNAFPYNFRELLELMEMEEI